MRRRPHSHGVDLAVDVGPLRLPNPDRRRVGNVRPRRRGRGALRSARHRRGHHEVGRGLRVRREPAAARRGGARRRDDQLGRPARSRASTRGSRTTCPRSKRAARASSRRSGVARVGDYEAAARALKEVAHRVVAIEVNLSCPNVEARAHVFAHAPDTTREATRAVVDALGGAAPVFAKLSPNVTDLVEIAGAALDAGATGLTLVNTVMGLVIDASTRAPRLGAGGGGVSGPPIKPVALRAVWEVSRAHPGRPDHRHRGSEHRRGRGRDAARRRGRGRRRHRDLPRPACDAAHRRRARARGARATTSRVCAT